MQKLYFESAWDKTIAPADREKIINHFQEQTKHLKDGVHFLFLWQAKNHKNERLITVLIHNNEEHNFRLQNTAIAYYEQDQPIATGMFSLPCEIAGNTSMPWTFIFSVSNQTNAFPQHMIMNDE
ncbi:SLAP domain-containing protein [Sporosarcina sp. G11-34]|uniref:SLAP domain-containing protein n=1 Tax=Sporosarcina sp. G11-34 TaxID=2849605 RepID=UPI0022A9433F|nr:SLAP domain-containing protein [Sporosarcina sp. G11-34]MCZ2259903.1 SLAP domain-containing protein [Sporosarcina sp. G11-34]